jgi:hypothetical protein
MTTTSNKYKVGQEVRCEDNLVLFNGKFVESGCFTGVIKHINPEGHKNSLKTHPTYEVCIASSDWQFKRGDWVTVWEVDFF